MTKTAKELKQLRADIDVLIKMAEQFRGKSRETSIAFTNLQEARMHVGNATAALGTAEIYKHSKDATTDEIDQYHVDEDITPMEVPSDFNQGTHVQNVKIMRREIDPIFERLHKLRPENEYIIATTAFLYAYKYEALIKLKQAQNWFGMELGRIRDESNG